MRRHYLRQLVRDTCYDIDQTYRHSQVCYEDEAFTRDSDVYSALVSVVSEAAAHLHDSLVTAQSWDEDDNESTYSDESASRTHDSLRHTLRQAVYDVHRRFDARASAVAASAVQAAEQRALRRGTRTRRPPSRYLQTSKVVEMLVGGLEGSALSFVMDSAGLSFESDQASGAAGGLPLHNVL